MHVFYCFGIAEVKCDDYMPCFLGGFFVVYDLIALVGRDDKELKRFILNIDKIADLVQNLNNNVMMIVLDHYVQNL